jgi:hypothetical protein
MPSTLVAAAAADSTPGQDGGMRLGRGYAWLFWTIAVWNVVTYAVFVKNLAGDHDQPTGFYVAHTILIIVNVVIAAVLSVVGYRVWVAARR